MTSTEIRELNTSLGVQLSFHELLHRLDAESIIMFDCSETRSVVEAGSFPLLYYLIARRITLPSASGKNGANSSNSSVLSHPRKKS